ncbi:Sodium/hydrogen exchanger [Seminavis robusta]|uniref:Sodium/hydrogen exchanger n=1 Tax=Seminavis robusta TaxID=568900 RepID=A0A9N8HXR4_9STRA|nr:Sodium/hydrogen exchanger [Seminavis robusta]|eukprot:Sro2588_g332000.1 Sodium/hydrogen exchanger (564) ;mRNA; r:7007-8893
MEKEEFANGTNSHVDFASRAPTLSPTYYVDPNATVVDFAEVENEHETDAITVLLMNVVIIGCLLLAYYVKQHRIYYLPESAGALMLGMVIGGVARLSTDNLKLFEFSPEVFFFFLLPPIIFEAGYSLKRKDFFQNIGAITLYAMVGTMISTFIVGFAIFYFAKAGLFGKHSIDTENPMEALLFGALISAVDPVATLSIMGSAELNCDPLLYSLVFGESVLNDAIAISLFRVFLKYYDPDGPDFSESEIPSALLNFCSVSVLSIAVGVTLGLTASYMYKHTSLSDYPNLETSLLFCFCYLCYATAEAVELSGIMALFFNGIVLSHYNSYNLSSTAHVASEQIFSTLATITETLVFVYMGMVVFTGKFANFNFRFSITALLLCLVGRLFNIFPLSYLANFCREGNERIPLKMQCVLWFAGLRGAIAFALAANMPGNHRDLYATATLFICIFTTVVCGGVTEKILTHFGMKQGSRVGAHESDDEMNGSATYSPHRGNNNFRGFKRVWKTFDDEVLKLYFGGSHQTTAADQHRGNFELGSYSYEISAQSSEVDELEVNGDLDMNVKA